MGWAREQALVPSPYATAAELTLLADLSQQDASPRHNNRRLHKME